MWALWGVLMSPSPELGSVGRGQLGVPGMWCKTQPPAFCPGAQAGVSSRPPRALYS